MEGLYTKVCKGKLLLLLNNLLGQFSRIPERFSSDLADVLKLLLQVQPEARPCCDQILSNPTINKKIENFKQKLEDSNDNILLQTIKVPKNILLLSDRLPQSNYAKLGIKAGRKHKSQSQEPIQQDLNNRSPSKKKFDYEHHSPKSLEKNKKKYYNDNENNNITPLKQNNSILPDINNSRIIRNGSPKINNHISNKDHINEIYQIYVPNLKHHKYINNNSNNYGRYQLSNDRSTHIKNIEKYYNIHNIKPQNKVENRKAINRKLSPIKRSVNV